MSVEATSPTSVSIVLNAHVPYVLPYAHWPQGTDWLFRTAAETYLPILRSLNRLVAEGTSPRLTIAFSPVLCEMLADLQFAPEFEKYLHDRIAAASANKRQFAAQGFEHLSQSALSWEGWYTSLARDFDEQHNRDILGSFRSLQDAGHLELITSPATQAVLPLLSTRESIFAQVQVAVDTHKKYFGRVSQGIWLPAPVAGIQVYSPALIEELLQRFDLLYFVPGAPSAAGDDGSRFYEEKLRLRGVAESSTVETAFSHPAALPLRPDLTMQVWSDQHGYAGDDAFLNFDRYLYPGGLPYWRHTARGANPAQTEPYDPTQIAAACERHAEDWLAVLKQNNGGMPLGIALDIHALGRWWNEGSNWLRRVLHKTAAHDVQLLTASQAMQALPSPVPSSGLQPLSPLWKHNDNAWVWDEIARCERSMSEMASTYREVPNPKIREILDQCARELLLMQDATWPLMMAGSEYRSLCTQRLVTHIEVFECLSAIAEFVAGGEFMSEGSRAFLDAIQEQDRIFPNIAFTAWLPTS
jgi:1,4-alpha-glucan branching enzyme